MSDPVSLFWLQHEPRNTKIFGTISKAADCDPVKGKYHSAHIEVDWNVESWHQILSKDEAGLLSVEAVKGKIPVNCTHCGLQFNGNAAPDHWFAYYDKLWTNPRTGKSGYNPSMIATPGACWFVPHLLEREDIVNNRGPLSRYYIEDWYTKREPFYVMCPDGRHWCPDMKSDNGEGWKVTGSWDPEPKFTASPSIDTGTYHSFLVDGVLGADSNCKPWTPQ